MDLEEEVNFGVSIIKQTKQTFRKLRNMKFCRFQEYLDCSLQPNQTLNTNWTGADDVLAHTPFEALVAMTTQVTASEELSWDPTTVQPEDVVL